MLTLAIFFKAEAYFIKGYFKRGQQFTDSRLGCVMQRSSTHPLHLRHTGRTESDAVAVGRPSEKSCSNCFGPLSVFEKPPFHCNQCDFTICAACDKPRRHPVHPNHLLYLTRPISPWRCDVCKRESGYLQDVQCYHCEPCDFHLCKKCFPVLKSSLHEHTLQRTDVTYVYYESKGEWACDVCRHNNGPGNYYPAHCSSCKFDLCDNCLKPWRSTSHPGHILYKADSNIVYPTFNGGWRCDRCSRSFIPQRNNTPFHCSQCEYDLCDDCMRATSDQSNARGFDEIRPRSQGFFGLANSSGERSGITITTRGNPIASPTEEVDVHEGRSGAPSDGRSGAPSDGSGDCLICLDRPKDATIVHGNTGHVCCCTTCANELMRKGARCPICRAPIDRVIRQYTV